MSKKLTILVGAPGAGKSTYADKIRGQYDVVLSLDNLRELLYGDANVQGYLEVTRFFQLLDIALEAGKSILIDNTNVNSDSRNKIIKKCPKHYKINIVVLYTPLNVCLERNSKRARQVPEPVVIKMHSSVMSSDARLHLLNDQVYSVEYIRGD